jgi:hypothetical protein
MTNAGIHQLRRGEIDESIPGEDLSFAKLIAQATRQEKK